MFMGFGHGLFFLLPLLFIGKFFWIIVLALVIGALLRGRRGRMQAFPFGPYNPAWRQPTAMEILRQRYARGEIDAVTFDQMRERLEASERADK